MKTTPIIGLEVHLELKTKSKMFCPCSAEHFHIDPNTHTCPVCLALPGALPVPNQTALDYCVKLGLGLNGRINRHSFFERKNYFYPDLPKGYQISQYQQPLSVGGHIKVGDRTIRINRAHMEEDTAKSIHQGGYTLIDFNRSGVPLVEIVSEPDLISAIEAKKYLNKIQQLVRYLDISDADIEKGSMRCEPTVNLKIQKDGKTYYTPLVEVKNVASLTGVQNAIDYEIARQLKAFQKTGQVKDDTNKTTRGWDADKKVTFLQRHKEGSSDYRYFPEPDIPPITYTQKQIDKIRQTIPELPDAKIKQWKALKLSDYDATLLAQDQNLANLFGRTIKDNSGSDFIKSIANLINGPIRKYKNDHPQKPLKITPANLVLAANAVLSKRISWTTAKENIYQSAGTGQNVIKLIKKKGQFQLSDTSKLEKIIKKVITGNPKAVADYKKNPNTIGFLIGQVMKASAGSANPQLVHQLLREQIN